MVIFQQGEPDTMIVRLNAAISCFDKEWEAKCVPEKEKKIQKLVRIVKKHNLELPNSYLCYLRAMGKNDDGLLGNEWDGCETGIDEILEIYKSNPDNIDSYLERGFFPFSYNWAGSCVFLDLSKEEPQVVFDAFGNSNGKYAADSFEQYLFHQAFKRYQKTFKYQFYNNDSFCRFEEKGKRENCKTCLLWGEADRCMALTKQFAQTYGLKETWFSNRVKFFCYSENYALKINVLNELVVDCAFHDVWQKEQVERFRLFLCNQEGQEQLYALLSSNTIQ